MLVDTVVQYRASQTLSALVTALRMKSDCEYVLSVRSRTMLRSKCSRTTRFCERLIEMQYVLQITRIIPITRFGLRLTTIWGMRYLDVHIHTWN